MHYLQSPAAFSIEGPHNGYKDIPTDKVQMSYSLRTVLAQLYMD